MGVIISPTELHVHPVFGAGSAVEGVLIVMQKGGATHLPLESGEKQNVSATGVHFVGLSGVDAFILD